MPVTRKGAYIFILISFWLPVIVKGTARAEPRFSENRQQIVNHLTTPISSGHRSRQWGANESIVVVKRTSPQSEPEEAVIPLPSESTSPRTNLKILFDFDSARIRVSSYDLMRELGDALMSPELTGKQLLIKGHTDSDGTEAYNRKLSYRRAEAVFSWLMARYPLDPSVLHVMGFGEAAPLVPNDSPMNRQLNRRVEIEAVQ